MLIYVFIKRDDLMLNLMSVIISILELQNENINHRKPDFLSYVTNT